MRHWIVAAAAAALLWPASAGAASPTPEQMANNVAQALKESGRLKGYALGVKFEDGVAWLEGRVTSQQQSQVAAEVAGKVPGVDHVVNRMKIVAPRQSVPQESGDLMLTMLEQPKAVETPTAPAQLPPNPQAMPATSQAAPRAAAPAGLPRPMARTAGVQANMPAGRVQAAQYGAGYAGGVPQGQSTAGARGVSYDQASMPGYAWPSYAAHPNYAAVSYPQQYSPAAWPYIGPFYPYPQVPLGWRKVTLEWDDGWWFLDFSHHKSH